MMRQDCGSLLEALGNAVDAAFALRIEKKDSAMAQAVGPGAHRGDQVGVGVDWNEPQEARERPCRTAAE